MRGLQTPRMSVPPPPPRVRFPPDDGFRAALKRGVASYFEATRRTRWGGAAMHAKTAMILGWFAASYCLLLLWGATSPPLAVVLTISVALATAGIGFSVMHDANHGAYSRSPSVNRAWGLALDLVGASSYVWRFKHNVHHHTYANIDGMDSDIDAGPFLRFAPSQRLYAFHRYQHLYAWPLYGVLAVKWWFIDDVVDLVRDGVGSSRSRGRAGASSLLSWPARPRSSAGPWSSRCSCFGAAGSRRCSFSVHGRSAWCSRRCSSSPIRCPTPRSTPLLEARSGWRPAGRSTRCAPPWTLRPRIVRRSSSALMAITRSVV